MASCVSHNVHCGKINREGIGCVLNPWTALQSGKAVRQICAFHVSVPSFVCGCLLSLVHVDRKIVAFPSGSDEMFNRRVLVMSVIVFSSNTV